MLNENRRSHSTCPTLFLKWIATAPWFLIGITLLGPCLSGDTRCDAAEPKGEFVASIKTKDRTAFRTKYISAEKGLLVAARPKEIFELPEFNRLAELLSGERGPMGASPVKLEDIESVLMSQEFEEVEIPERLRREGMPATIHLPTQNSVYLNLSEEYETSAFDAVFPFFRDATMKKIGDEECYVAEFEQPSPFGGSAKKMRMSKWHPTKRSLVVASDEQMKQIIDGRPQQHPLAKSSNWKAINKSMLAVAVDSTILNNISRTSEKAADNARQDPLAGLFARITKNAVSVFASVDVQRDVHGSIVVVCKNQEAAVTAEKEIDELLLVAKKMLGLQADSSNQLPKDSALFAVDLIEDAKVTLNRTEVRINVAVNFDKFVLGPFFDMLTGAKSSAAKAQNVNNLRQHALAALNFESATGAMPTAVITGPNGHKHSWRVAVLPYLGEQELYNQYRFDEAWDSEHNKSLITSMPAAYRHPDDPEDSTSSSYYAFVGPGTVMGGEEATKFRDVRDGTSKTILYVEAKRDFPWTQPEDIPYDPAAAPNVAEGGFFATFMDGSVRWIEENTDPVKLHNLIQIADESDAE